MSTKAIELKSVKLPRHFRSFQATVKQENIRELRLHVDVRLETQRSFYPINGKIEQMASFRMPLRLREDRRRFQTTLKLDKPPIDLGAVHSELLGICQEKSLSSLGISIISAIFDIGGDVYLFQNHRPSKALVLKSISGSDIGKMTEEERDKLLNGKLKFAAPSTCTKTYKEEWKCE